MRCEELLRCPAAEGRVPGKDLVCHDANRVDVGPVVDGRVGGGLLGRHVRRGAHRHAAGREHAPRLPVAHRRLTHRLGHAEVGDERMVSADQHVVRLDIAVNDALLMGVGQRIYHVPQQADSLDHRQLPFTGELGAQRFAVDERHGVKEELAGLASGQNGYDVRVLQLRGELDLAAESLHAQGCRQVGRQHLDDHLTTERSLLGLVDAAHAAGAELPFESVGGGQRGLQAIGQLGHVDVSPSRNEEMSKNRQVNGLRPAR